MHEELLKSIGLTNGETKVYLTLLKIGENTVSPIAKEASVSLSKIYEILNNLIKKGLAGFIYKNNIKYFKATEPERIIDYLKTKKQEIVLSEAKIKTILPTLKSKKDLEKKENIATLYEGFRGIKNFYESVLKKLKRGDELFVLGISKDAAKEYEGYFMDWNKQRAKKGASIKLIFNYDAKELGEKRKKIPLTQVVYLPENFTFPAWILIYKKIVATIHLIEKPICLVVCDENIAESYKQFFNLIWNISSQLITPATTSTPT